jgi:hypothetical protein
VARRLAWPESARVYTYTLQAAKNLCCVYNLFVFAEIPTLVDRRQPVVHTSHSSNEYSEYDGKDDAAGDTTKIYLRPTILFVLHKKKSKETLKNKLKKSF